VALLGCGGAAGSAGWATRAAPALDQARWHWTDEAGEDVTLGRYAGSPVVLTAFFTSCTTRCPLTIERLRALDAAMRRRGIAGAFVLVTLDPRTDGPARLRRYKEEHGLPPSWHLLRGDLEETRALARALGLRAAYDDGHIDHDVRVAIFDRAGRLARTLDGWSFDEDQVAQVP
jgi:protein SCO1/2